MRKKRLMKIIWIVLCTFVVLTMIVGLIARY